MALPPVLEVGAELRDVELLTIGAGNRVDLRGTLLWMPFAPVSKPASPTRTQGSRGASRSSDDFSSDP